MLAQRVLAGVVGVPIIFLLILAGGDIYVAAVALTLVVATVEFQRPRFGTVAPLTLFAAALVATMSGGAHVGFNWVLWVLAGGVLALFVVVLARFDADTALFDWLWSGGALLYVGLLGAMFVLVRDLPNGRDWAYLALFTTFSIDTAAYFSGRAFGRHKLAPRISPGKTIEGFAGGYVAGIAAALLLNYFLGLRLPGGQALALALLLPLAATAGDLAESAIKRSMQIKDASELIPGHGGVLDRLDSLLFVFTVVFLFEQWVVS